MKAALGLIETIGLGAAITALDAAAKAADVKLIGYEKVIGVDKEVGVTINIAGEVAAVKAAVDAGVLAGNKVGRVVSGHVIPRPHEEVDRLIEEFEKNLNDKTEENKTNEKNSDKKQKKTNTEDSNKATNKK